MNFFKLLRAHLEKCGVAVLTPELHRFDVKNLTILILSWAMVGSALALLFEDRPFNEVTDILFRSISTGAANILYSIIVWKTSELRKFINSSAHAVAISEFRSLFSSFKFNRNQFECNVCLCAREGMKYRESQALYIEISEKIERLMRVLDFAFYQATPIITIGFALIVSFSKYYLMDLGQSSFQLPSLIW